jgi:hypothetical protein
MLVLTNLFFFLWEDGIVVMLVLEMVVTLESFALWGVTGVIGCEGWFSCSTQVVLEMPFCYFCDTFECVAMQFVNGAPLTHCNDRYRAQLCIGAFILALFFMVLISRHLQVSIQVLLEVRIYAFYMKTKKLKNVLNLDSVQVHKF